MNKLFYLLFTFLLLSSCSLLNKSHNINIANTIINIDTVYVDDSTKVGIIEVEEKVTSYQKEKQNKKGGERNNIVNRKVFIYKKVTNPDFKADSSELTLESDVIRDHDYDSDVVSESETKNDIDRRPSSTSDKIVIDDRTTDNQLSNSNLGIIAYSIPKQMQVGKTYTVKLRISKEKNKIQLINGDGIPLADIKVESKITISSIRVEPVMSAKLITDSSKMIVQLTSTETQDIEKQGFTEWSWRLTPTKGGDVLVRILVTIKQKVDNDIILKDIPVYDEVVSIKSNMVFSVSGFISQYWQWIMTTIIIPLVIWIYNKKRKRDK